MDWEMENVFIMEIPSLGEMWPLKDPSKQIWPCARWGMANKVNMYCFKVDGIIV